MTILVTGGAGFIGCNFVRDRLHVGDHRAAINASRVAAELGRKPVETFDSGLARTVRCGISNIGNG